MTRKILYTGVTRARKCVVMVGENKYCYDPKPLLNRNLLYTAVTRARKCVTIIGSEDAVHEMIRNESEMRRNSGLADSIIEMEEADNVYI